MSKEQTSPRWLLLGVLAAFAFLVGAGISGIVGSSKEGRGWNVRCALISLAAGGAILLVGAALFVWSGIYDVAASAGHFPPLRVLLHYAMEQSVAYHAPDTPLPQLDDPALVLLGAAHYHTGCAPCHGAPGNPASPIESSATPPPPALDDMAQKFSPNELHWIVKHGIKMTAMPAWPSQKRGDEVWALVAFLERLPRLDKAKYRQLAIGPGVGSADTRVKTGLPALKEPPPAVRQSCARCHGLDGEGRVAAVPNIAGLKASYISQALADFADGSRPSGFMGPVASRLTDADKKRLAHYFSSLPRKQKPEANPPSTADLSLGEHIARFGAHGTVPACMVCHAKDAADRSPGIPQLQGQSVQYLETQLHLFRNGVRAQTSDAKIMSRLAKHLSEKDIKAVSAYLARLRPDTESTNVSEQQPNPAQH